MAQSFPYNGQDDSYASNDVSTSQMKVYEKLAITVTAIFISRSTCCICSQFEYGISKLT